MRSTSRPRLLMRLVLATMALSCGFAQASDYYTLSWGADEATNGIGGGTASSYPEALQAVRAYTVNGVAYWQYVAPSEDPNLLISPFFAKAGYSDIGINPAHLGSTVDAVCTVSCAAVCATCFYRGFATPWNPQSFNDHWTCNCQDSAPPPGGGYFNEVLSPYCSQPRYYWSEYGQQVYNGGWRPVGSGVCYTFHWGNIVANNFNPDKSDNCCHLANPVHPALGNKTHREGVYTSRMTAQPLIFEWLYSTNMYTTLVKTAGWSSTFARAIAVTPGSVAVAFAYRENGFVAKFALTSGVYVPDADVSDRLVRLADAGGNTTGWTYTNAQTDEVETYSATGQLVSIQARSGASLVLAYSDASTPTSIAPYPGLLISVTDPLGRQLSLAYSASGRPITLTDPTGGAYTFAYDQFSNLASITWPDGHVRQFLYENSTYANALTGIVDENGQRFSTYSYDSHGRAINTQHAGGTQSYSFAFNADGSSSITDPLGTTRTFGFATVLGAIKNASLSQPCATCGINSSAIAYDANGNVASRTDFNNKKVCYAYDLARNLETARLEGALSSETCSTVLATPPNRSDVRKITTTWNPTYRLPVTITEPAPGGTKTTTLTYDATGNLTQKSITAPKNDGSGTNITRTWNWTYTTFGRVLTATDPNGKVTTYAYYSDTDSNLGKRGNVQTITNAAGHITQITSYDANGRPLTITDPNGLVTTLAYDARGRLTSRQVGGELTGYVYDGVGQLTKVTQPDSSYVQYTYDAAHRLTQLNDGLGNKITYALDGMGNRVSESAYDPSNNLARTRSRIYNALNQLYQDLGAASQTTSYTYDNNYNLLTTTDPLNHSTGNLYDALNRLTRVLDPNLGTTTYAYDGANNLTQVTDANLNATAYSYDGLNDLVTQTSPDTGTTTNTYDAAGNILTKTDARGATATYTYDNLNRATQIVYSKSGNPNETHTFTYDVGTNAKGRLAQVTDPAATTAWTYTSQGRIASKTQTVGNVARSLSYGYNSAGQLTSITTPSGQQVGYSYSNNRVSGITVNAQAMITGATTEPFGPLAVWQWANGLFTFRDYDHDGRLATWEFRNGTSLLRKDQSFDLASRIVGIADPLNAAASQTYQYDLLDRLTVAQTGSPVTHTQQFTYDPVGNRLNATLDGGSANLYYNASNRLQGFIGTISAGYLNGATALTYTYNNNNRLVAIQSSGTTIASYAVSALGQRVSKSVGGVTTLFVYDEQGHLLGEYDGSGNLIEETVWLEDLPVATLRATGTGNPPPIAVYYVHADHLGSARAVTRPSDNAIMWQWDNVDPFGANAANENPAGQGAFKYGMRFPGQYYDAEIGTSYNYFRDYDPTIGRYEQSDPVGLRAGMNTYSYAKSAPAMNFDPRGLTNWSFQWGVGGGIGRGVIGFSVYQLNVYDPITWKKCTYTVSCGGFGVGLPEFGLSSPITHWDDGKGDCSNCNEFKGWGSQGFASAMIGRGWSIGGWLDVPNGPTLTGDFWFQDGGAIRIGTGISACYFKLN